MIKPAPSALDRLIIEFGAEDETGVELNSPFADEWEEEIPIIVGEVVFAHPDDNKITRRVPTIVMEVAAAVSEMEE